MATLAIAGGEKTVVRTLGKAWPIYDEREEKALIEVLKSGVWWRGGFSDAKQSKVGQFEDAFAAYQHAKYAVALTNGTAAIECAWSGGAPDEAYDAHTGSDLGRTFTWAANAVVAVDIAAYLAGVPAGAVFGLRLRNRTGVNIRILNAGLRYAGE